MPRAATKKAATKKAAEEEPEDEALTGIHKIVADATDGKVRANIEDFVEWLEEETGHEMDAADAQIVVTGYKTFQRSEAGEASRERRAEAAEEAAAKREAAAEERAAKKAAAEKKATKKSAAKKSTPASKRTAKKGAKKSTRSRRTKKVAEEEPDEEF
jgi:hypothetical protein